MAHVVAHDAQLHAHVAPEAVSKVTSSTAPAAAVGRVRCAAYRMGTGVCAPLTVGVAVGVAVGDLVGDGVGAAAHAQSPVPPHESTRTGQVPHRIRLLHECRLLQR
jgi:hypothetical protein